MELFYLFENYTEPDKDTDKSERSSGFKGNHFFQKISRKNSCRIPCPDKTGLFSVQMFPWKKTTMKKFALVKFAHL